MVVTARDTKIKPGYKLTEIGLIPEDWEMQSLEGITDPKASICYGIVQVGSFASNGIPVLAIKNLNTDYSTNVHRSSPAIEALYARSRVCPDDVLISVKGTIGRVGIVPQHFVGNISRDLARLRLTERDVPEFWFQMLQSESAQRGLGLAAVGTTRMELSIGILKRIRMLRPPKVEQCAIARVLNDVGALIECLDKLIAKKRGIKQATMQQLLTGKTQLPGFSKGLKQAYKQTEVGVIPEGWDVSSLDAVVTKVGSGITPTGGEKIYKKEGRPFLRSQNVGWGYLLLDDIVFINDETHSSFSSTEIRLDDVLLNITGASIGRSAVADNRLLGGNVNQHVCIIRADANKLSPYYLNFLLLSKIGQKQIESFQAGGNRQGLNFGQIRSFQIPLPSLPEQTAIATVLSDMDAEIVALEQKRDKTRALKQGMMQELLTGKTRLL